MARRQVTHEFQPDRIEFVQRTEFPARVPPFGSEPIELLDFLGIDGRAVFIQVFYRSGNLAFGKYRHVRSIRGLSVAHALVYVWPAKTTRARPENVQNRDEVRRYLGGRLGPH